MATLSQFGIPGAGTGVLHPRLKHKWRVTFVNFSVLVPGANSRDLTLQCINVTRPNISFEEVPLERYNSRAYVAGKHTWEPCTLTVEDDITGLASYAVTGQLETQQRLIGADLDGQWLNTTPTASGYKFGMLLDELDGNESVTEQWKYEGCFISACDWGDGDYASSDPMTITLTIRYDHVRQILQGQGFGTAIGGQLQ